MSIVSELTQLSEKEYFPEKIQNKVCVQFDYKYFESFFFFFKP